MCRTTSRRASAMAPLWPVKDEAPGLLRGHLHVPSSKSHARPCGRLAPPSRAGAVATRDIRNAQVLPASPCALWGGRAPAHHLSQSERDLSGCMRGAVEVSVAVGVPGISIEGHKGVDAWPHPLSPAGHGGMVAGGKCGGMLHTSAVHDPLLLGERHRGHRGLWCVPALGARQTAGERRGWS